MQNKRNLEKIKLKLKTEGLIKALIIGLIAGFAVSLAFALSAALANNFANLENFGRAVVRIIWFSLAICALITAVVTPLCYFLIFRFTAKQLARRVDRLGLEERMITRLELENDASYIAMRQRDDAKETLQRISGRQLKITIFVLPLIIMFMFAAGSAGAIVSSAVLFEKPVNWEHPGELPPPLTASGMLISYHVTSLFGGEEYVGGYIEGNANQYVTYGDDAKPVKAVADSGYAFLAWSDGLQTPERQDKNIQNYYQISFGDKVGFVNAAYIRTSDGETAIVVTSGSPLNLLTAPDRNGAIIGSVPNGASVEVLYAEYEIEFIAIFVKIETSPSQSQSNNPNPNPGDGSSPDPDDLEYDDRYDKSKQVIDGETYYDDPFEEYFNEAMRRLAEGESVPDDLRWIIEAYYKAVEKI